MIKLCADDKRQLIETGDDRNVFLEGNIIKLIDAQDDESFKKYLLDAKKQDMEIDMNAMYRYCMENFIVRTEPSLTSLELIRLNPYIGNQLKEILPNPLETFGEDESKNEE